MVTINKLLKIKTYPRK